MAGFALTDLPIVRPNIKIAGDFTEIQPVILGNRLFFAKVRGQKFRIP
jgi:hypothetical protein